MTVVGGESCFCFACWERRRFAWGDQGELVCPTCGTPEGTADLVTEEMMMKKRNAQAERDTSRAKKFQDRTAATLATMSMALKITVLLLLPWPVAAAVTVTEDALVGNYSLAVTNNENLKKSFVATDTTVGLNSVRAAFDFNMADATLVANKQQHIWQIQRGDKNSWLVRVTVQYESKLDRYRVRAIARMSSGSAKTAWVTLPDPAATYRIEVSWSTDDALGLKVDDGETQEKVPSLPWITDTTGMMRLGAPLNTKFFVGTLRFDEVNVSR